MSELATSLSSEYFQLALVTATVAAIVGSVVGVHVVLRRQPFFVAAMSHATFPGVVLAAWLGVAVSFGALVAGLLLALVVARAGTRGRLDHTNTIGVALGAAFAIGIIALGLTGASSSQAAGFLVGSVLTVGPQQALTTCVVGALLIVGLVAWHRPLIASAFDGVGFAALGYRKSLYDLGFLVLVTIAVVLMIPVVGTLLPLCLMVAPAATAQLWCKRIGSMVAVSLTVGLVAAIGGLFASAAFGVSAGGAVALIAGAFFALSLLAQRLAERISAVPSSRPTTSEVV
jgi:ABC-type Mn2+/Zn2+ transport system permease subunit